MKFRLPGMRHPLLAVAMLAVGCFLTFYSYAAEHLLFPAHLLKFNQYLYRPLFMMQLPVRILVVLINRDYANTRGLTLYAMAGFVTPWLIALWAWRTRRLMRLWHAGKRRSAPGLNVERRRFLVKSAAGMIGAGAAAEFGYLTCVAPQRVIVQRYHVPIRDLPPSLDGLRIAHLSDMHYGPYITADYIRHVVDLVNGLQPDLIVLTGDYIDHTPRAIADGIHALSELRAPLGIAGVLGNHDHWTNAAMCRAAFRDLQVPLIDNGRMFLSRSGLSASPASESICIAGVGDLWPDTISFSAALNGVPEKMPRIVLAHNPDTAEEQQGGRRIDLMLSGHTHGGQVRLPILGTPIVPSKFGQKYAGGLIAGPNHRY